MEDVRCSGGFVVSHRAHRYPRPPHASQNTRAPSVAVFGWGGRAVSRSQWESGGAAGVCSAAARYALLYSVATIYPFIQEVSK